MSFRSISDIARLTGSTRAAVHYWIATGRLPAPPLTVGKVRMWPSELVDPLAERIRQEREAIARIRGGAIPAAV